MRHPERFLYALLAALALFVGSQVLRGGRRGGAATGGEAGLRAEAEARAIPPGETWVDVTRRANLARGVVTSPSDPLLTEAAPPRWMALVQTDRMRSAPPPPSATGHDSAEVRRLLKRYDSYTYLGAMLREQDSTLVRWPDRAEPLRVWVQPASSVKDWRRDLVGPVRAAFHSWSAVGTPITFALVDDSTQADVHVTWVHAFTRSVATHQGRQVAATLRVTNPAGWIVAANITIALHPADSATPFDIYTIQTAGLHEIGHLLGLDHSPTATDVMAPTAYGQDRLSVPDRATVRALYTLPPGRVR